VKVPEPSRVTAPPIDFSKPRRKVVRRTPAQAYSVLFCERGSPLREELYTAWKAYVAADQTTIEKYKDLLPNTHNPDLPFVAFQQYILKDKVTRATEEELTAIQEFIETRYQEETDRLERPWRALKTDDTQLDVELERQYINE